MNFCFLFSSLMSFSGDSSILVFFGKKGYCVEAGRVFLLFPVLLFSGSISKGSLREFLFVVQLCLGYVQKCDFYEKWPIFSCQKRNKYEIELLQGASIKRQRELKYL